MASYACDIIAIDQIVDDSKYCLRYSVEDESVQASVAKHGVLFPLLVRQTQEGMRQVIAGHRRLHAARLAKIEQVPVLDVLGDVSAEDLFLLAVVSNWQQSWHDLDISKSLKKALDDFSWSAPDAIEQLLPAFGLPQKKHVFEDYLRLLELHPELLVQMDLGQMPVRGSLSLLKLTNEDQQTFAQGIASEASLTTNQLIKLGDWLGDLLRASKQSLQDFLKKPSLREILEHVEWDGRQKSERLFEAIRRLYYPRVAACEEKWEEAVRDLRNDDLALKFEAPAYFEDQGFTLHARLKSPELLDEFLTHLSSKKHSLNSLFDIML